LFVERCQRSQHLFGSTVLLGKLRHLWKSAHDPKYREWYRLMRLPYGRCGSTSLMGLPFDFVDGRSCALQYKVIFQDGIYGFEGDDRRLRILDVGANIGMSVLFFKRRFPRSDVIAFEADPVICDVLRRNVRHCGLDDVEIVQAAVMDREGTVHFSADGSDGGAVSETGDSNIEVRATRLLPYLEGHTDLLKMDIEGCEVDVLIDCVEALHNVDRLFVEYHSTIDCEQRIDELVSLLTRQGFRLYVQTDYCPKAPFQSCESSGIHDLRLNIFAIRAGLRSTCHRDRATPVSK